MTWRRHGFCASHPIEQHRPRALVLAAALFPALSSGCAYNGLVHGDLLAKARQVQCGGSRPQVAELLGGPGEHQFSVFRDRSQYHCTAYRFGDYASRYYFLFENDRLEVILDPQPLFRFETVPDPRTPGTFRGVELPWTPEDRLQSVFALPGLSKEEFVVDVAEGVQRRRDAPLDLNVLPAFIIVSPLYVPHVLLWNMQQQEEARRYNPWKVRTGMTVSEVDALYGEPGRVETYDERTHRTYGPRRGWKGSRISRLTVVFEHGRVTRILGGDFLIFSLLPPDLVVQPGE